MNNYLYLLLLKDAEAYKVGITKNLVTRVSSIERSFGSLAKDKSFVYACENRKKIENIEAGIHALLSKYPHFHKDEVRNGSSEWFCGTSFDVAFRTIEIFVNADIGLSKSIPLISLLNEPINYDSQMSHYKKIEIFSKSHNNCIQYIDSIINVSKPKISVLKTSGFYVLDNLTIPSNMSPIPIEYQWFEIRDQKLFLDIKTMNRWKIDRVHKEICNLILMKYFDSQSLRYINSIFDKDQKLISSNTVKIINF